MQRCTSCNKGNACRLPEFPRFFPISCMNAVERVYPLEPWSVPKIFYVDDSGTRIEGDLFAVGSGSNFALGILDTERHDELTQDQAIALGIKAIRHATFRDAYSGGLINVYLITRKDGWQHVFKEDLARLQEDAASLNASGE
jgi:20S proteasome alpha/beta subunit